MEARWKRWLLLAAVALLLTGAWIGHRVPRQPVMNAAPAASAASPAVGTVSVRDAADPKIGAARRAQRLSIAPSPPMSTPLAQVFDELGARAAAGDPEAASTLYQETLRCSGARQSVAGLKLLMEGWRADVMNATAEKALASMRKQLDLAEARAEHCNGIDDAQLALAPAALRAAQLGDDAAADCYVGAFAVSVRGLLDHPEWLAAYKQNALPIANAAIEHGDWTMVLELQQAYSPEMQGSNYLSEVTGTDAALAYRYAKLLRLGTPPTNQGKPTFFDQQLAALRQELSPHAIAAAETWADETYRHTFASRPFSPDLQELNICTFKDHVDSVEMQ